jgi:4-diphosphocytidyl-2-C-methyl-D-erythritol kinase
MNRQAEPVLYLSVIKCVVLVDRGWMPYRAVYGPRGNERVQIRRGDNHVEVLAPAKVNLFFEVLSRRDDGFHEIETLMVPISLYDTLILSDDPSSTVSIECRQTRRFASDLESEAGPVKTNTVKANIELLPTGDANIAVRAVRRLAERAGVTRGAKLQLVKRVPMAAGLGGGSSDAAAALVAANLVWKLDWTTEQLAEVAAELGSDVPFFLNHGAAICRGRGEKIMPTPGLGNLHLVLVRPPEGLSTAAVYKACTPGDGSQMANSVLERLRSKGVAAIGPVAHNRLLEPARRLSPWIDRTLAKLKQENCPAIGMSGSGTTCFAACRSAGHARQVAARIRNSRHSRGWVKAVSTI